MKRFFLFSLSITLLCGCSFCGFKLWKIERTKKEKIAASQRKKERLDEYYFSEFKIGYLMVLDDSYSRIYRKEGRECIDQAKINMIQDGYNRAEIEEVKEKAMEKADDAIERRKMIKYEQ
ncbi:MAG: hypothetical protein K1000chlam3_01362 [Chlamydiae bacterium]|nr:hypothetical protein [Chlamydiota bacterium]